MRQLPSRFHLRSQVRRLCLPPPLLKTMHFKRRASPLLPNSGRRSIHSPKASRQKLPRLRHLSLASPRQSLRHRSSLLHPCSLLLPPRRCSRPLARRLCLLLLPASQPCSPPGRCLRRRSHSIPSLPPARWRPRLLRTQALAAPSCWGRLQQQSPQPVLLLPLLCLSSSR